MPAQARNIESDLLARSIRVSAMLGLLLLLHGLVLAQSCDERPGAPGQAGQIRSCAQSEPASLPVEGAASGVGNPVDLRTGFKYERRVDLALPDVARVPDPSPALARAFALVPSLAFVFSRHYRSGLLDNHGLGPGWRHGFDTRLRFHRRPTPVIELQQADGRRIAFAPGANGAFISARARDGVVERHAGQWRWRWPGGRRLVFDARGRIARIESPDGERLLLRYRGQHLSDIHDRAGRTLRLRYRMHLLVALEAPGGRVIRFAYDKRGRLVSVRGADTRIEHYWYADDAPGARLLGSGRDNRFRSHFAYDNQGRVVRSLAAGEHARDAISLSYEVAPDGRQGLTRVRHAGGEARYRWQAPGPDRIPRLVASDGVACSRCPPSGLRLHYDAAGRISEGAGLRYRRDALGQVIAIESTATADRAGPDMLETRRYAAAGSPGAWAGPVEVSQPSILAAHRRVAEIAYDADGRVRSMHETGYAPDGSRVARRLRLRWHRHGPLAGRLLALERVDPANPDRVLARTRLLYDTHRRLSAIVYPGLAPQQLVRDPAGQLVGSANGAGMLANRTSAAFRLAMRGPATVASTLVLSRNGQRASIDGAGRIRHEHFDDLGRLAQVDDPQTGQTRYRHDALDRLHAIIGPGASTQTFDYDAAGRLVRRLQTMHGQRALSRFTWNDRGLVRVDGPRQQSRARYDAAGRIEYLEHRLRGARFRQRFEHDAAGRLVVRELPDGSRLHFHYDARGRPLGMGRVSRAGAPERSLIGSIQYRGNRLSSLVLGNRIALQREFDADGRLDSLRWSAAAGPKASAELPAWRYRYDEGGRIRLIDSPGLRQFFARDRAGRIIVARDEPEGAAPSERYFAFGPAGDMLASRDRGGRTRIIARAGGRASGGLPRTVHGLRLRYGAQRRIISVHKGDALLARYRYNFLGERILREAQGSTNTYLYHRRRLMAELDDHARLRRLYLYWQGRLLCFIDYAYPATGARTESLRWVLGNHLGTPAAVVDEAAQVLWRGRIGAFGELLEASGSLRQPLRLPGQIHDPETGLSDNYQRSYDPRRGRYLEPDPLAPAGGRNHYAYAQGDPLSGADPLGLVLFAFDGTGNTPESRTNVWLMAEQYADYDAFDRSIAINAASFYVAGVGTTGGVADNALVGGTLAVQLRDRVDQQLDRLDAYVRQRLGWYLDAGASIGAGSPLEFNIDIVGFSRGAAAARDFANQLLRRRDRGYYRELVDGGCVSLNVRFMGLFDTVLSSHVGEFDLDIPEAVGYAASAIAANEHRRAFPLESIFASAEDRGLSGNRTEVSFAGAHADIGGGYDCGESAGCDGGDLSDIALQWMRQQAQAQGVALAPLPPEQQRVDRPIMHDETSTFLFYDPDPLADREVRYHAASSTLADAPASHAVVAMPETSRTSIAEGMTAEIGRELLRDDAVAAPGVVGEIDMLAYTRWLREEAGVHIQSIDSAP